MASNMNPLQLIQLLQGSKNPQQFVMNMLEQQSKNNPLFANLLTLAKGNQTQEIEQIARNMAKEKGIDYDKEFNSFKNNLGIK